MEEGWGKRWSGREGGACVIMHTCATSHVYKYLSLCRTFCMGIKSDGVNPLVLVLPFGRGCESSSCGSATSIPWHTSDTPVHMATGKGHTKGVDEMKLDNKWNKIIASFMNGHPEQVHVHAVNPKSTYPGSTLTLSLPDHNITIRS